MAVALHFEVGLVQEKKLFDDLVDFDGLFGLQLETDDPALPLGVVFEQVGLLRVGLAGRDPVLDVREVVEEVEDYLLAVVLQVEDLVLGDQDRRRQILLVVDYDQLLSVREKLFFSNATKV